MDGTHLIALPHFRYWELKVKSISCEWQQQLLIPVRHSNPVSVTCRIVEEISLIFGKKMENTHKSTESEIKFHGQFIQQHFVFISFYPNAPHTICYMNGYMRVFLLAVGVLFVENSFLMCHLLLLWAQADMYV